MGARAQDARGAVGFSKKDTTAEEKCRLTDGGRQTAGDLAQCAGEEKVVAIQPAKDVPCGACEALIDRLGLAGIPLRLPVSKLLGVTLDNCAAAVVAAAVHDDVFEIRVTLTEHAQDRRFEKLRLPERGRDDGDLAATDRSTRAVHGPHPATISRNRRP